MATEARNLPTIIYLVHWRASCQELYSEPPFWPPSFDHLVSLAPEAYGLLRVERSPHHLQTRESLHSSRL